MSPSPDEGTTPTSGDVEPVALRQYLTRPRSLERKKSTTSDYYRRPEHKDASYAGQDCVCFPIAPTPSAVGVQEEAFSDDRFGVVSVDRLTTVGTHDARGDSVAARLMQ